MSVYKDICVYIHIYLYMCVYIYRYIPPSLSLYMYMYMPVYIYAYSTFIAQPVPLSLGPLSAVDEHNTAEKGFQTQESDMHM